MWHPKATEALEAFQDREPEPVVELGVWAALTTRLGVSASGTGVGNALRSQNRSNLTVIPAGSTGIQVPGTAKGGLN